jgi:hypothetical protein
VALREYSSKEVVIADLSVYIPKVPSPILKNRSPQPHFRDIISKSSNFTIQSLYQEVFAVASPEQGYFIQTRKTEGGDRNE